MCAHSMTCLWKEMGLLLLMTLKGFNVFYKYLSKETAEVGG